ncbi:MAG TPA: lysozyme inhibitor LprI family protein [Candidatus Ozemobacteraceae bacterium]
MGKPYERFGIALLLGYLTATPVMAVNGSGLLTARRADVPGPVAEPAVATEPRDMGQEHPIDRQVTALLERDESTAGQNHAFDKGERLWDAELNRCYRDLTARLDEAGRKRLRDAQRAWLAFRDAEFARLLDVFGRKEGTMFGPMLAAARMKLVRERAQELADALRTLDI